MEKIEIWMLLITSLSVVNTGRTYQIELNINESKKDNTDKVFAVSTVRQLTGFFCSKELWLPLTKYEKEA